MLPDYEVDPFDGKLKPISLQQNSISYNPLNRNLLYTKAEIDAKISVGNSADMQKATYDAANVSEQLVGTTATQTLTNKTYISGISSTVTAAGTTTLTASDTQVEIFTGTMTQTVKLPTTSIAAGRTFTIINQSSGSVTVQSSDGSTITTLIGGTTGIYAAKVDTPTTAPNWLETVTASATQTLTNKTLTSPKIGTAILDTNGNNMFTMVPQASAVNYMAAVNGPTGTGPSLQIAGSDTNVGFLLYSKGTGLITLRSSLSGGTVLTVTPIAGTGANYINVTNAVTTASPTISANGSDTNVDINIAGKGTGVVKAGGVEVATISGTQTLTNKTLTAPIVSGGSGTATIRAGTGTPEGAVTATVGSLFMRTDGGASTTLYVKESGSGNTGWIAK